MNFVRGIFLPGKGKIGPRHSDAKKIRRAIGRDANQFGREIRSLKRRGTVERDARSAENPKRCFERLGRVHEQVIAHLQDCLIERAARSSRPSGGDDWHFRIVYEDVAWFVALRAHRGESPISLSRIRPAVAVEIEGIVRLRGKSVRFAPAIFSEHEMAHCAAPANAPESFSQ